MVADFVSIPRMTRWRLTRHSCYSALELDGRHVLAVDDGESDTAAALAASLNGYHEALRVAQVTLAAVAVSPEVPERLTRMASTAHEKVTATLECRE